MRFEHKPAEKILLFPDPLLLQKCAEITDLQPWKEIASQMFGTMKTNAGCGLAAPQVGLPYTMFVLNVTQPLVVINPCILEIGKGLWMEEEGCLSLPGQRFEVVRPRKVKVQWTDLEGAEVTATFEGWTGRAWQHEFDHLQGILINGKSHVQ